MQTYRSDAENGYQGRWGDTLYTDTQGRPVILIGNVSDVIPNLQVTLVGADGTELVYHPALGLCDNTIALPATPKVYDFSLYSTEEAPVETDSWGAGPPTGRALLRGGRNDDVYPAGWRCHDGDLLCHHHLQPVPGGLRAL